jgi:ADP-heptose:LPS heptosyltransferase
MQLQAEIHFLTKEAYRSLFSFNPYVSKVITLENFSLKELQDEKYNLIIDLHKNLRTFKLRPFLNGRYFTFSKKNLKKWLMVNFKPKTKPISHIVDRYFKGLSSINIKNDGQGLDLFIDPDFEDRTNRSLPSISYYVLVLGANYYTKRIPLDKCFEIIKSKSIHCILIGGNDTLEIGSKLNERYPEKVINLAGKLNLHESAAVIKKASYVITGDTGMMHVAAAFQKIIYVLWGSTTKQLGMYPYYGSSFKNKAKHLEVDNLACQPCSKLGHQKCPKKHFKCMLSQDISIIQ